MAGPAWCAPAARGSRPAAPPASALPSPPASRHAPAAAQSSSACHSARLHHGQRRVLGAVAEQVRLGVAREARRPSPPGRGRRDPARCREGASAAPPPSTSRHPSPRPPPAIRRRSPRPARRIAWPAAPHPAGAAGGHRAARHARLPAAPRQRHGPRSASTPPPAENAPEAAQDVLRRALQFARHAGHHGGGRRHRAVRAHAREPQRRAALAPRRPRAPAWPRIHSTVELRHSRFATVSPMTRRHGPPRVDADARFRQACRRRPPARAP
jgi:hypothetical protein